MFTLHDVNAVTETIRDILQDFNLARTENQKNSFLKAIVIAHRWKNPPPFLTDGVLTGAEVDC